MSTPASLIAPTSSTSSATSSTSSPTMSSRATKIVGFLVAGAALVALGDVAPQAAIGLASVVALGVVLSHASDIQQLTSAYATATGH